MGSFTKWKEKIQLTKVTNKLWLRKLPSKKVNIPGNCGQPEFQFIINNHKFLTALSRLSLKHKIYDGHQNSYKNIIHLTKNNLAKIQAINHQLAAYKTNYNSPQELANFRLVPAGPTQTSFLYRSYHPFIKSKPEHPREKERINTVQQLIKRKKINSIINLSDSQAKIPELLPYYRQLTIKRKNIIFINREHKYDIYYYSTHTQEFTQLMAKIILFILYQQPPFLIHCRIGTDRTGVIAALLAAFLNNQWSKIIKDYKQSNKTGIKEYRDEKLLKYTFQNLLGNSHPSHQLKQKVTSYFKNKLSLSCKQLKTLETKLTRKD